MSFSDQNVSVLVVVVVVVNFYIFIFFSRITGPMSTKPGTKNPWVKGIKGVKINGHALFQGGIIIIAKIY